VVLQEVLKKALLQLQPVVEAYLHRSAAQQLKVVQYLLVLKHLEQLQHQRGQLLNHLHNQHRNKYNKWHAAT
jgi:hypothetical protein